MLYQKVILFDKILQNEILDSWREDYFTNASVILTIGIPQFSCKE